MELVDEVASAERGQTRRTVLKRGGVLAIAISLPAAGTGRVGPTWAATAATPTVPLSAAQTAILDAIVERFVPADANGPGGKEAGVSAFIARALGGKALAPLSGFYTAGLDAVDAYAQSLYGAGFAALAPDQQDRVLADVASGKATGFTPDSATFFATIHEHTLEGLFSDPVYGGNQGFAGWNLIGYPGVRMPVPPRDQKIGVVVKPAHKSTYAGGQFAAAKKESLA
jgi:gluconate 2-dehydrogenase gamma chain